MLSVWNFSSEPTSAEAERIPVRDLPADLTWPARVHYWAHIHVGEPARILVVDVRNWQIGRHIYFVPVPHIRDMEAITRRHQFSHPGNVAMAHELHWSEFVRLFPRPTTQILGAA